MRMIHNGGENPFRMPLFLPKELEFRWLDPNLTDNDLNNIIDYEMPSEELSYYTVASIRSQKGRPLFFPSLNKVTQSVILLCVIKNRMKEIGS